MADLTEKPLDVHLMIVQPEKFIKEIKELGTMMMQIQVRNKGMTTAFHRQTNRKHRLADMCPNIEISIRYLRNMAQRSFYLP